MPPMSRSITAHPICVPSDHVLYVTYPLSIWVPCRSRRPRRDGEPLIGPFLFGARSTFPTSSACLRQTSQRRPPEEARCDERLERTSAPYVRLDQVALERSTCHRRDGTAPRIRPSPLERIDPPPLGNHGAKTQIRHGVSGARTESGRTRRQDTATKMEMHIHVPKPFEVETGVYGSSSTVDKEGRT